MRQPSPVMARLSAVRATASTQDAWDVRQLHRVTHRWQCNGAG